MQQKNNPILHLFAIEKLTLLYVLLTSVVVLIVDHTSATTLNLLTDRLSIAFVICMLTFISSKKDLLVIRFIRNIFVGSLLIFWYPETFDINRVLPNYDHLLANWEQSLFGCQPALLFCQKMSYRWFSELLNMGYFAYYPLIACTGLYFYLTDIKYFQYFYFTVLFAFFSYYLVFILFPTAGPQYYFAAIGAENVNAGIFPALGTYFNTHPALAPIQTNTGGFFQHLVESTQQVGERPTAAFPSSHVGISTLIMLLIARSRKFWAFAATLPFYLALVAATVYIQAHYLIDVIAGLISSMLLFYASTAVYRAFTHSAVSYRLIPETSHVPKKE